MQRIVESLLCHERIVTAVLYHSSVVQNENHIGIPHGREAVSYDYRRLFAHKLVHRALDSHLRHAVDV